MGANVNVRQAEEVVDRVLRGQRELIDREHVRNMSSKLFGTIGEELALRYLEARGYSVLERNYRCAAGEADIVAFDPEGGDIVLVEVKTRRVRDGVEVYPEEAVTPAKQQRYRRIALAFQGERGPCHPIRFDVISVSIRPDGTGAIRHLYAAFDWEAA